MSESLQSGPNENEWNPEKVFMSGKTTMKMFVVGRGLLG